MSNNELMQAGKAPGHSWIMCIKDPGSALTHFAGLLFTLIASPVLLVYAALYRDNRYVGAFWIFIASMALLYAASTLYHTFLVEIHLERILKKLDHMMIFVLIAGTYTPVCILVLPQSLGRLLLVLVWGIALAGIAIKALWVTCPRWFSSVLYIAMGWVCVIAMSALIETLSGRAFAWLLAGGIAYTVGGVVYALKLTDFNEKHPNFGTHEIFHLFVLAGSFCHFVFMFFI